MIIIIFNAAALTFVWVDIDPQIFHMVEEIQEIFNYIFIVECLLKLIAYQKFYFYSGWNVFDFVVVGGGILGTVFKESVATQLSVIRILRVCRVLRLLKKAKRLYIIFSSFLHTIPLFINVGSLIIVMIFIFSAIGNRIFAKVMLSEPLNETKNFQTFGSAFMTLIISMTGEGWYEFVGALGKKR